MHPPPETLSLSFLVLERCIRCSLFLIIHETFILQYHLSIPRRGNALVTCAGDACATGSTKLQLIDTGRSFVLGKVIEDFTLKTKEKLISQKKSSAIEDMTKYWKWSSLESVNLDCMTPSVSKIGNFLRNTSVRTKCVRDRTFDLVNASTALFTS